MAQVIARDLSVYGLEVIPKQVVARDLSVYALEAAPPSVNVRSTDGYLLRDDPRGNNFRQVTGHALRPKRKPDFSKDALTALYLAASKEWSKSITSSTGVWLNPRSADSTSAFNSLVTLQAVPGSHLSGSADVRYDRYELADAFAGKDLLSYLPAADSTVYGILPALNAQFGISLTQSDVNDGPVQAGKSFVLSAGLASFYFMPGSSIVIGVPALGSAIAVGDLTGFNAA